jgi:hypothetical protein
MSVTRADLIEGSHRRMAEVHIEYEKAEFTLDRYFRHYEEAQANQRELGQQSDQLMSPMMEAAYGEWRKHGPHETRLALTQVGEAPVGEELRA